MGYEDVGFGRQVLLSSPLSLPHLFNSAGHTTLQVQRIAGRSPAPSMKSHWSGACRCEPLNPQKLLSCLCTDPSFHTLGHICHQRGVKLDFRHLPDGHVVTAEVRSSDVRARGSRGRKRRKERIVEVVGRNFSAPSLVLFPWCHRKLRTS